MMKNKLIINEAKFDFIPKAKPVYKVEPGLTKEIIEEISYIKEEPDWMKKLRLKSLQIFNKIHTPRFGVDVSNLDLSRVVAYMKPGALKATSWEDVPNEIKEAFEKLGIPEAERKALSGVGAQYDSEIVYRNIQKEMEKLGVIFLDMESAVKKYPDLVKKYFMKLVPPTDHKYAALHGAIWSGGTFLYVPENVRITMPLQAYFLMSSPGIGQFEHTIIVAERNSEVTFIEGCSAPRYNILNLHTGMVEIYVKKGAKVKYMTIQNWSKNTYNLNTKRAIVEEGGFMSWVSGSFGSGKTMLYPTTILKEKGASSESISITYAGERQHLDTGSKMIHLAPYTSSVIQARSISMKGGWAFYRGLLKIEKNAKKSKATVSCTALMLDNKSKSDTLPIIEVRNGDVDIGHEARVGRISEDQIFYLMTRGLSESEARSLIVKGFIEPVVKELPLEYAVELYKLVEMEIESSIG